MVKKRKEQQRIGEKAVKIFGSFLEMNKELDFSFFEVPGQYDSGIDGVIQIFKLEIHTGEYYYAQIKGSKKARVTKNNTVSFSLDIEEGDFLLNEFKGSAVFILVDLSNKKIYWHDIQTNKKTIDALQEALRQKQKTFTLHFNPLNTLPETHREMYEYLKQASTDISKREVQNNLKKQSISKSFKDLKKYEDEALNIKGYKKVINKFDINNAVMSIKYSDGELITYFPEDNIKEEDLIRFKLGLDFDNKEEATKFNRVLKGIEDSMQISSKNIRNFEVGTKDKKIYDSKTDEEVDLIISQAKKYNKLIVYIPNLESEITLDTQVWESNDGTVIVETYDGSEDIIGISIKIKGEKIVFFKLYLRREYVKDLLSFYKNFNFIVKSKKNLILFLVRNGIRTKIGDWQIKRDKIKEKTLNDILNLTEKLLLIQEVKKINFNFIPLKDFTKNDISNIDIVYDLLKFGESSINLNITLNTKEILKIIDGVLILETSEPYFIILDETVTFSDIKLYAIGKPEKIEEISKDSFGNIKYLITIPQATLSFKNYIS